MSAVAAAVFADPPRILLSHLTRWSDELTMSFLIFLPHVSGLDHAQSRKKRKYIGPLQLLTFASLCRQSTLQQPWPPPNRWNINTFLFGSAISTMTKRGTSMDVQGKNGRKPGNHGLFPAIFRGVPVDVPIIQSISLALWSPRLADATHQ